MCLAVPAEIITIDQSIPELRMAQVSIGGTLINACVEWLPEANVGDFVLVHAGMAITKIDKEAAEETLLIFKEMGELLEKDEASAV